MGAVSIFVFLGLFLAASCNDGRRHTRFEYKLSFKGPHLVNKQGNVPFWKHYGSKYFASHPWVLGPVSFGS